MKLFFAAPLSGLPSEPIALGSHASRLHFARKLVLAAPASSLPSFPTALLAHVPGVCAAADPIENAVNKTTSIRRVIGRPPLNENVRYMVSVRDGETPSRLRENRARQQPR